MDALDQRGSSTIAAGANRAAPKVGVVVVNFRTPDLTLACVRSLKALTYPRLQVFVVDNASNDGSLAKLREGLDSDEELIASLTNGGYTAGNNLGMQAAMAADCEVIHLLNPDTVVLNPKYLDELVAYLADNPDVGAVGPRVHLRKAGSIQNTILQYPWLWRRLINAVRYRVGQPTPRSGANVVFADALNGVCVLYRTTCLQQVGGFDERIFAYVDEAEWAMRARRLGWRLAYLPVDGVVHLQKESGYQRAGTVDFLLKRNTVYFLMKNRRFLQAAGYTAATIAIGFIMSVTSRFKTSASQRVGEWNRRLLETYWWLWTAQWSRAMGRPSMLDAVRPSATEEFSNRQFYSSHEAKAVGRLEGTAT